MNEFPGKSRLNPFYASIKERRALTQEGAQKLTQHIVLDISGSDINYSVGDSIGVLPTNQEDVVDALLAYAKLEGKEEVIHKKTSESLPLRKYLTHHANITDLTKGLVKEVHEKLEESPKKERLGQLLHEKAHDELKLFLETYQILDFFEEFLEGSKSYLTSDALISFLKPLLPRFYSIASSSLVHPNEIHLTVVLLNYEVRGKQKKGVCTSFLCESTLINTKMVPIFIQPSNGFTLPQDQNAPLIMIGPGTGVAPFRAFLEERKATDARGKNWLIFGERNRKNSFFYEDFFLPLQSEGFLELDLAFSRDQPEKIYVQHRMKEKGKELYKWLQAGAFFYVCGDAKRMARDVDETLHEIIREEGNLTPEESKAYVKELKKQKRYLRDVY